MIGAEIDLLRVLLDYAPAAIALFDRNMTYIAVSRRFIADYRLTDMEIVGRSYYDVFPEIPEHWKAIHRRCLAGAVERAEEEPFLRADGSLDWMRWEIHPWHEQSGAIGGIILFSEVITARKLAADALLESEKRFRVALASAPLTVFNQDQNLRSTWISNPTLGETAERAIGRTDEEILGVESAAQLSALKRRALGAGESTQEEVLVRNNDAWAYYDLFIEPVHNKDHEVIGITGAAYDVTELKRTQQQLLELNHTLEERIRQRTAEVQDLYDNSPTGYHSLDDGGNLVRINQTELNWLGYTYDEVIGRPIAAFFTPASLATFQANFPRYKARGWLRDLELELIRKDGSIIPVIVSATAIYDDAGNYVMSRTTVFDNTERKKVEDALRASQARLNFLLSQTPATIFTASVEANLPISFVSESVRTILGYEPQQYLETPDFWMSLIHPDDLPAAAEKCRVLFETGHATWMSRVRRADGSYRWISTGTSMLYDEKGVPTEVIGYAVDADAQKRAEESLRESEEQTRLLFEQSPDAIVLFDLTGRIVRANHALAELIKRPLDTIIGRHAGELGILPAALRTRLDAIILPPGDICADAGTVEHILQCADGIARNVESRFFLLKTRGASHVLVASRDISAHKQAEEALRRANVEMERTMKLKDEFLANMSHELRTPLNGILTASEILAEQIYGPLNERQLRSLHHVETCGQHLLAIVSDLLDISKIEAGKLELELQPVALDEICRASLLFVSEFAQKKQIELSYNNRLPYASIQVDPLRLKQILVNLLDNAVKFTPEGGQVQLIVCSSGGEEMIDLAVQDSGPGIASANLPKLFQPFSQLDAGLARQFEGTGLGLALVKRLVVQHGGTVRVESAGVAGQGSRFTVSLPCSCVEMHP